MLSDRRHRLGLWGLRWMALAILWLALTDTRALPELVVGAVVAALGATFAGLIARPGPPHTVGKSLEVLRLGPLRLGRPLVRLGVETGLLTAVLWRRLALRQSVQGSFRAARYRADPALASAAGRAAIEIWGSLAPNRYVVGIDDEAGVVLVHELVRTETRLEPLGRT